MPEVSLSHWSQFLQENPDTHFLQTVEWADLKSRFGWEAARLIVDGTGAQILFRKLPLGLTIGYIPKPALRILSTSNRFWTELDTLCRSRRAIHCMIEPDDWELRDAPVFEASNTDIEPGVDQRSAPQNLQPRRTIVVDLRPHEDQILERMKPKCRYNVRLAQRSGVSVRVWKDISGFHKMIQVTAKRDRFGAHTFEYYRRAHELFHPVGGSELLVAMYGDRPLAALMVFTRGRRAWYVYGGSTDEARSRMPNYLLQWEAMRWAKNRGCEEYDLWGVPDEQETTLEEYFNKRHDGLWGVYRFKRGFGGELKRAAQAVDRVYQPILYAIYVRRRLAPTGP